jgi:uncharacterized membrane protein (DUF373 family)
LGSFDGKESTVALTRFDKNLNRWILIIYHAFERIAVILLLLMMMVVVASAVYEMAALVVTSLDSEQFSPSSAPTTLETLITLPELHSIFGLFLSILIGIELLETMKIYLIDDSLRVEIVFLVAMIGITRHVIDLDYKKLPPLTPVGIATVILSLTVGYYYLKKSGQYPWRVQLQTRPEDSQTSVSDDPEKEG